MAPGSAPVTLQDLKFTKLYRVYCTCMELCSDRGYTVLKKPSIFAAAAKQQSPNSQEPLISYTTFLQSFLGAAADTPAGAVAVQTLQRDRMTLLFSKPKPAKGSTTTASSSVVKAEDNGASSDDEDTKPTRKSGGGAASPIEEAPLGRLMVVFHSADETLSMPHVIAYRSKALKKHAESLIIVAPNRLFANVRRDVSEVAAHMDETTGRPIMHMQVFEEDELVVNPTKHETVPKHTVLSQEELAAMLKRFGTTVPQLPRMLFKDPIAQYYGLQRGEVVRIDRDSEASGPYEMYRQVI